MGKSEKISRAKKDKINNLRKKYDDFLEDDRKRRDRNVYILERLERMRSSVASLQINQKGVALGHNKLLTENSIFASNSPASNNNRILMRRDMMNYRENSWDDNSILKEISKKYILIPKIHTITPTSSVMYPVMDVDINESDWKNKYNILEELKRNDREEPPEKDMTICPKQQDTKNLYKAEKDVPLSPTLQDSNILNKRNIIEDVCESKTITGSKTPSTENIDKSKCNNNRDMEKPKFHSYNTNKEFKTDEGTAKPTMIKTISDSSIRNCNPSINNSELKNYGKVNDFQGDRNEKVSRDATEKENIVIFSQESNKQIVNHEKQHIVDEMVKIKEPNSQNSAINKQETIVNNKITNEIQPEYKEAKDVINVNEGYAQNDYVEDTLKTNSMPISDESNDNVVLMNEEEFKNEEITISENSKQDVDENQGYEHSEIYANDNNYTNEQYAYYEQPELQQAHNEQYANVNNETHGAVSNNDEKQAHDEQYTDVNNETHEALPNYDEKQAHDEQYTNVNNVTHEAVANYDENQEQQYANDYGNEYNNQYENQTFNNYETHNNYEQNPNYEYQEQEHPENTQYINSENYVPTEPTQETNLSNSQEQYYNEPYTGETHSQQEIYEHVAESQDEIQQQINMGDNYVDNQENNMNGVESEGNAFMGHEMLNVQQEYVAQNYAENEQQQHVNDQNNYVESEENNVNNYIGVENATLNQEIQDIQHNILQSNNENEQQYVESYEEGSQNIGKN